jgi:cytochrome d ubiquinol oxidase subunit I
MNDAVFIGFASLGLAVVLHIIFTVMTLGAGLLAALYRWRAYRRNNAWA